MGVEIERKFLLQGDAWRELARQSGSTTLLRQGYLSDARERVVRVRIDGEQAFLTIKGQNDGIARPNGSTQFHWPTRKPCWRFA